MTRNTYIDDDWDDNALTGRSNPETGAFLHPAGDTEAGDCLVGMYRPEWTTVSGMPSATSGYLSLPSDGTTEQIVETQTRFEIGEWKYDARFVSNPSGTFGFYRHEPLLLDASNDWFIDKVGDSASVNFKLGKNESGTTTKVISGSWTNDSNWHTDRLTRSPYADWELFHDGTSQGTATDSYMPNYETARFRAGNNTSIEKRVDNFTAQ